MEVKEELGLLKKRKENRKIKAPGYIKKIIKEAIKRLGYIGTYKEIQEKNLEVYKKWLEKEKLGKLKNFMEVIKPIKVCDKNCSR